MLIGWLRLADNPPSQRTTADVYVGILSVNEEFFIPSTDVRLEQSGPRF